MELWIYLSGSLLGMILFLPPSHSGDIWQMSRDIFGYYNYVLGALYLSCSQWRPGIFLNTL